MPGMGGGGGGRLNPNSCDGGGGGGIPDVDALLPQALKYSLEKLGLGRGVQNEVVTISTSFPGAVVVVVVVVVPISVSLVCASSLASSSLGFGRTIGVSSSIWRTRPYVVVAI